MGHSKETPRQKMIGMMYLVLTCLLALNVSKEILEGFVTINESIENTNSNFSSNTKVMMDAFEESVNNGHHDARPYYYKAKEVCSGTQKTFDYVEKLKMEVKLYTENTEGADTMRLSAIEQLDNFDKPTYMLIGSDEKNPKTGKYSAAELRKNIEALAAGLDTMIDGMQEKDGCKLPEKDYLVLKSKLKMFTPHDNYLDKDGKPLTWEFKNFYNMPLAAVVTNLSKIQSDIRNIEAEMITTFASASTKLAVKFNQLEARIVPVSRYVQSGSPYTADVFLTASSTEFKEDNLQFILGDVDTATGILSPGAVVLPIDNGTGKITLPTPAAGNQEVKGWIKFRDGNGKYKYFDYRNEYVVANPAVAISADEMNVLYVGVDNPISVSAAGVAPTDLLVKITGTGASLSGGTNGKFNAKGTTPGTCSVTVYKKTSDGLQIQGVPKKFRIKKIPSPPLKVQGKMVISQADMSPSTAQAISVIGVDNSGFDFNAPFKINEFTVSTYINNTYQEFKCSGSSLSQEAKNSIRKAKRGSKIYFENIKVKAPDGIREFPMIKINVK